MENNKQHLEALTDIRALMERSSKFISLSGMSGICAGIIAFIGAIIVNAHFHLGFFEQVKAIMNINSPSYENSTTISFLIISALIVFAVAFTLVIYFSSRKAKKLNISFWDNMAKRVFINLFIFLLTGGVFCLILVYYGIYFLIVPSMLIFYGLALINVSKFTFNEISQLGIIEILLGIVSSFLPVYPLLMWLIGFGILHLIYGTYVYIKYERA